MPPTRRRPSPLVLHLTAALAAAVVVGAAARVAGLDLVLTVLLVWAAALLAVLATGWLVALRRRVPARPARVLSGSQVFE